MKVIDAHLHFSDIETFHRTAAELSGVTYSSEGLHQECAEAGVVGAIGMGLSETAPGVFPDDASANPMGLDLEGGVLPKGLGVAVGVNPMRLLRGGGDEVTCLESTLRKPTTVGIKIYAGYYHFYVHDEIYQPVYDLAAQYKLPVVIHCGDTYSPRGLLKYSHPLTVDELAVERRDVNFVLAHFGDPWMMETAELLNKNPNLYADLSGLIVGDGSKVIGVQKKRLLMEHYQRGLAYLEDYTKVLYGSDWPLVPMRPYINFVKELVPEEAYKDVFYENALRVFPKLGVLFYGGTEL